MKYLHAAALGLLALAGGTLGFKLVPDTELYSTGHLFPYGVPLPSLAGAVGAIGGLPALVVVSTFAAAIAGYLTRSWRFTLPAAWFFLFPGADALGVAALLLTARVRGLRELVTGLAHPPAALVGCPGLWRLGGVRAAWAIGLVLVAGFTIAGVITGEPVSVPAHIAYAARYLLPALALSSTRFPMGDGRPTTVRNGGYR